jgi:hypothetical protein
MKDQTTITQWDNEIGTCRYGTLMIVDARLRELLVNSNTLHMKHFLGMSGKSIAS